jgi:glycosyltransferase involved in cell wall biosynthesis
MQGQRAAFVIPGDLSLPTGGYAYDRHVLARATAHGVALTHVALPGTYPAPTAATLAETERQLGSLAPDLPLLIDGLAYGAMPADLVARIRQPIVALVHHPLCLEAGLTPAQAADLRARETAALTFARAVIVTSPATAGLLTADFGVASSRITVAEPGTNRAARATGTGRPLRLLAVGSIVPRKAYDVLLDALAGLTTAHDWHLTIVGAVRDAAALATLQPRLAALGARVTLASNVDDVQLDRLYAATDLFVLPSHYEGYGMVLTEALVRGLPIVTTDGVAAALTLGHVVRIVPAGNVAALRAALAAIVDDDATRRGMADASWAAAATLPTWDDTTRIVTDVIKRMRP